MSISSTHPGSPSSDTSDENANTLGVYLHKLAGHSVTEVNPIFKDHTYSRPWNWKPDNIYVKPVKKIFFNKPVESPCKGRCEDEDVDVEEVNDSEEDERSAPYDLTRSRLQMEEFQRLANFARPDEPDEDWEEKIDKFGWTPMHHRIFARAFKVLRREYLVRVAKSNSWKEPIYRRCSIDTASRRYREALAASGWDLKITQWLHGLFFDNLPRNYLAIYLDILQALRLKIPQLIDRMMTLQPTINTKGGSITWETLGSLLKRSWDPLAATFNSNRPKKLPGNPILIIAPSGIGTGVSSRQHKWMSQLGYLGTVVNVHIHAALAVSRMTMIACMDQLVQVTRAKIQDVRGDCPGRPIILVGFNTGAALACQIALLEHVTAVICLGFPLTTVEGKRGSSDDTLMDIKCPVIFVVGQNASLVRTDELEDVRERMMVATSLVVVGTADDQLRVSTTKKISDGITQSMVDRCILDEIGDFIGSILLQPHPLPLRLPIITHDDARPIKKDPRKRKSSVSSSIDGETGTSVKKTRPGTPSSCSIVSQPIQLAAQSTLVAVGGGSAVLTGGIASNAGQQPPVQKRKPRAPNTQKNHFPENIVTSKHVTQDTTSANGGITLNIGSLASLAPIGPIRLAPSGATQIATSTAVSSRIPNQRSAITMSKVPKMIQTGVSSQTGVTKIKTLMSNSHKGFSKVVPGNYTNMITSEKGDGLKSVNVTAMPGNNMRLSSLTSTSTVTQNKPTTTSAALTALLQSGKSPLGLIGNTIIGRSTAGPSGSVLLTTSNNTACTITTSTTKVTDSSNIVVVGGGNNDRHKDTNWTLPCPKKYIPDTATTENSRNNRVLSSTMSIPMTNKTPITILPLTGGTKSTTSVGKSVPKITINSNNANKARGVTKIISTARKNISPSNEIDDELGNIFDIPIIFAKEGDNLSMIEKATNSLGQIHHSVPNNAIEPVEKSVKRLSSATKLVLISNKQDKMKSSQQFGQKIMRQMGNQAHGTQVLLQARSQISPMTIATNGNTSVTRVSNQPTTIKYTKIILSKRNSGIQYSTSNVANGRVLARNDEQVVVTKSGGSNVFGATITTEAKNLSCDKNEISAMINVNNDDNEIVDVARQDINNVIERKSLKITEIDLTSPTKNQDATDSSLAEPNDGLAN